jgi:hypothetical protein
MIQNAITAALGAIMLVGVVALWAFLSALPIVFGIALYRWVF